MENFKVESKYRKLCNEFRAIIRHMKTAFYRPDYQKLLMCPSIKRLGRVFASNMQPSLWKSQPSFSNTRTSFWGFKGKLKAWLRVWKARPSVWKSRICVIPQSVLSQSRYHADAEIPTTKFSKALSHWFELVRLIELVWLIELRVSC